MTNAERPMLPIGTRVRHLKGFPGDDQREYPAGIEGQVVSHGSLGYHGISFVFENIEATFLFFVDEVEVLPMSDTEETLRAELEAVRKTLTETEGRARRYSEERDTAQSALSIRYAMRREIEEKLGMVSGEANDESLRRGLEAIRALENEREEQRLRAEKAEERCDEALDGIESLLEAAERYLTAEGDQITLPSLRSLRLIESLSELRVAITYYTIHLAVVREAVQAEKT